MARVTLLRLVEHNHWANPRLFEVCAFLTDEQLDARDVLPVGDREAPAARGGKGPRAARDRPNDMQRGGVSSIRVRARRAGAKRGGRGVAGRHIRDRPTCRPAQGWSAVSRAWMMCGAVFGSVVTPVSESG